jgi:hypothetical protein
LCAARAGERDPDTPRWASALIAQYSRRGHRVQVRAAAVYPGLPGEVAALVHAAAATDRDAAAVLPTPGLAARTRALLPAFTGGEQPLCDEHPDAPAGRRPRILVERGDTPHPLGAAALLVVLAGPVRAGATSASAGHNRRGVTAKALAGWARELAPGGSLVLLCPPQPGNRHDPPVGGHLPRPEVVRAVGLSYTQHLVLVHVPVVADKFAPPGAELAVSGPFTEVHTDAFVFTATAVTPASSVAGQHLSGSPHARPGRGHQASGRPHRREHLGVFWVCGVL